MSTKTLTPVNGIRTVGIPVTDQDRALEFYLDRLGLEKRMDHPFGNGIRWIEVGPPGTATTIALVGHPDGVGVGVETGVRLTTEDADALYADLEAGGVDVDHEVLRWPGVPAMFAFRDPDGNSLEIVEGG
jgi:catechol 2,3-dioxygenase-like lactoylglutathione lyase family enzyme